MKSLTKEQYEYLSHHKENMRLSATRDYSQGMSTESIRMISHIYNIVVDDPKHFSSFFCSSCVKTMLKELYPYYLSYEKLPVNEESNITESEEKKTGRTGKG